MEFTERLLEKCAEEVKVAHLTDGVPPTETVSKIATRLGLNIEQVKRVCEESNKAIKVATKAENPQLEFPVADSTIVFEGLNMKAAAFTKEASADDGLEALDSFGGKALSNRMSKIATAVVEKPLESMSGSRQILYLGARKAASRLEHQVVKKDHQIEKVACELIDILYKEATQRKSINDSYTALMKHATTAHGRTRVHDFYVYATEAINKIASYPVILTDMGILDKTASVINPDSDVIREMNKYITLRVERDKTAAMHSILKEKLETFANNALRD